MSKPVVEKKFFIIDGSAFLYRAYYALKPLHSPDGRPVQAVYGFCRMFKKLINDHQMNSLALVWDMPGKTKRHAIFAEYKATRQAPPSDLFDQKELIIEFADLIGVAQVGIEGFEADDLIYSLAKKAEADGFNVVIISSDKDMGQIISDTIVQYDPVKSEYINIQVFKDRYGFEPYKLPLFYAFLGDASDNIPGARGIGKKTATDLVMKFESLDEIYKEIDLFDAKLKKLLLESKENVYLSFQLFMLHEIPFEYASKNYAFTYEAYQKAQPFFKKLNFKSLLEKESEISSLSGIDQGIDERFSYWQNKKFSLITTSEQLSALIVKINQAKLCAIDTETTGKGHPTQVELVGISFAFSDEESFYVPCASQYNKNCLDRTEIFTLCKEMFEDAGIKKVMHNAKYDLLVLERDNFFIAGISYDTMIMARLLLPEWEKVGLKALSLYFFNEPMITFDDVMQKADVDNFAAVSMDLAMAYAAADAYQTYRLYLILYDRLKQENLLNVYETIEHPTMLVLKKMEEVGILVKPKVLQELGVIIGQKIIELEASIAHEGGFVVGDINLNSPRQIEQLLFVKLGLPPQKKSAKKTGFSTDVKVLSTLAKFHPVPGLLLQYRELIKLQQTYIEGLLKFIDPITQKIHTSFNQTTVATGRLSSSEPNMQNIPADGVGLEIRKAFVPPKGNVFIGGDYSQIELRVLAHLSQDKNLIRAFLNNYDIHAQTASGLFGCPIEEVTHDQRQFGKRINFSILYGKTPFGLSQELGISVHDAKTYIDKYFEHYPSVRIWMKDVIEQTQKKGFVETMWGRRRFIEHINAKNQYLFQEACRVAVNTVLQGTSADIVKLGMQAVDKAISNLGGKLILQIHDEVVIQGPTEHSSLLQKKLKNALETVVNWTIPLTVDVQEGVDWWEVSH
jgi:DNA polymerase-1